MKPAPQERARLLAAATTAYRGRDAEGRIQPDPSWLDLDADDRRLAFEATVELRALEAASADDGLSSTARAVLARIRGSGR